MRVNYINLSNGVYLFSVVVAWWLTATKIEPFLLYHFQQIGFSTGFEFFKTYLNYPGGISDYVALFLSQFFSFNIAGSLIIIILAALQGLIALHLINRLWGKPRAGYIVFALHLIFGILVLSDYHYPYYATVRLLFTYIFIWVFWIIQNKLPKFRYYVWPVMGIILFYVSSGIALLIFAVSSVLILINSGNRIMELIAYLFLLIFAGVVPFIGYKLIFPVNLSNLYRLTEVRPPEMLSYTTSYQIYIYYLLLPGSLIISWILLHFFRSKPVIKAGKGKSNIKTKIFKKPAFYLIIQLVLTGVAGYVLFIKSYDPFSKNLVYIDYYAEKGQWNDVLKTAENFKVYDFRVNYQVNRANANLGQLPEKLFNYPQLLGSYGLFLDEESMNGSFTMPISDLYFDLGFMSESLHWAFEAQTLLPNSPRILKRVILCSLITQKYDIAQKFLNVLDKNILYHKWVEKYNGYVADTVLAANDPMIAKKRLFSPNKNAINFNPLENLKLLIETNRDNRMAYDYLLSLFILDMRMDDFIQYIPYYTYYNLKTLPDSWGEGLSFYILKNKNVPSFMTRETISEGCRQRLIAFNNTLTQFKNDKTAAQNTLRANFEHTYWYYILYLSPAVTKVLENKAPI